MRPRVRALPDEHGRDAILITLTNRQQAADLVDRIRAETATPT